MTEMINALTLLAANAPQTGDNFPKGILIAVVLIAAVAAVLTALASKKKNAELVIPRQVIMYICREYTDSTYESVAHLLGKKDHSTVIHGVDKIKEELLKNEEMRNNVDNILKKLNL